MAVALPASRYRPANCQMSRSRNRHLRWTDIRAVGRAAARTPMISVAALRPARSILSFVHQPRRERSDLRQRQVRRRTVHHSLHRLGAAELMRYQSAAARPLATRSGVVGLPEPDVSIDPNAAIRRIHPHFRYGAARLIFSLRIPPRTENPGARRVGRLLARPARYKALPGLAVIRRHLAFSLALQSC
jgi:hypothetical protein